MENNPEYFSAYCHPATVSDHTKRMRNNYVWGTHCEVVALLFKVPIFVAIRKTNAGPYYWIKFSSETRRHDPKDFNVPVGAEKLANTTHVEFYHLKDAVLCITTSRLAQDCPYQDKSSNSIKMMLFWTEIIDYFYIIYFFPGFLNIYINN